jgi:hypothetical protein
MIVNTIDQVREVVPINALVQFETVQPYLSTAEKTFIRPIVGEALYEDITSEPTDPEDPDTVDHSDLLVHIRYCIVNYAMFHGFDMLNVTFDENGFKRSSEKTGLYRYQEENLKEVFKNDAYNGVDRLIEYLQKKISTYEAFKTSPYYLEMKGSFFPSTHSFDQVYSVSGSRLVFLKISRFFERVVDFEIVPLMGRVLFNKVVDEMRKEDDQDPDLMALIPYIRKPLAFFAVANGLDEIGMQVTEKGLLFETQIAGSGTVIQRDQISPEQRDWLHKKTLTTGIRYKSMLFDYLRDNASKYPDFLQGAQKSINPFRRENSGKKTFWT